MFLKETRLISISMIVNKITIVLLFIVASKLIASDITVEKIVRNLGRGESEINDIQTLSKTPALSIELLIKELRVVPDRRLLQGQNPFSVSHVAWCISALRFITGGLDFCAQTNHVFKSSDLEQRRETLLKLKHGSCLSFFSVWMSRGSMYIAPPDAQRQIIQQWHEWFKEGKYRTQFTPLKDPQPQDWLW